jgi:hypothetical protein
MDLTTDFDVTNNTYAKHISNYRLWLSRLCPHQHIGEGLAIYFSVIKDAFTNMSTKGYTISFGNQ